MDVTRKMPWKPGSMDESEPLVTREWLVTNGLGGYASGTVAGVATRRYHGLLIAAHPAPLGRMMMLNHLSEQLRLPSGETVLLSGEERVPQLQLHGAQYLDEFRLEMGLPVWRYRVGEFVLEKRLFMPHHENTSHIVYRLVEGKGTVRLKLMPSVHFRSHDAYVSAPIPPRFELRAIDDRFELFAGDDLPTLRLTTIGERPAFTIERRFLREMLYRIEESRGYDSVGDLWSPGYFRFDLSVNHDAVVTASTESWDHILAIPPAEALQAELKRRDRLIHTAPVPAQTGLGPELVLAADQFLIRPVGRVQDLAVAKASGDERRTVIAGYHWFTDWGRDTMISLEGLTLSTGRHAEAGYILRTFAHYIRDGLIPNMFPEGQKEGLYHTADATLWFFHALDRYVTVTGDVATRKQILPQLVDIYDHHVRGTRFKIGVDPADGLLRQGEVGYQLTWMDAKMGDWVVTPRRGKAVEINALWYNAVRLLERWVREDRGMAAAEPFRDEGDQIRDSFNRRFWNEKTGCLWDVIDGETGDDPACRPNQLFAIALPNPVLDEKRWKPVVDTARRKLLTPVGLRSLAPDDPEYKPNYHGDLRTRDAAYHQGTVWGWLIGPYVDAALKAYPDDRRGARQVLEGFSTHLGEACIGSISEVFDAESPFLARGCCAQAWSVAEVLRCWIKTEGGTP
ncbi:amylo-alpha-1,6-glucosidase [Planctomyces sp. SH-PL14]|uniref:amylo-alpha-1,6-glucosidase n=1 Tax=Planctomyces sp. SH-PL14 TaxID=1632864 RepID=UPI00078D25EC|nr:amylo-alpha-1,6-glucosidase [Planctomyces sp. SH-PL14]AMV22587.1 Amylo-alpha-1,6-glucosidase [Planctomyces sp. SH-PL14]